jgi:hypothetical protein
MIPKVLWAITTCVLLAVIFLWLFVLSATSDQLWQQAIDQAHLSFNPALDKRALNDLNAADKSNWADANLYAKWNDVYDFAVSAKEGGGIEVIARLNSNGHFDILWQGQDVLPCEAVDEFQIPLQIAPRCTKSVILDRSNVVRAIYSELFSS